LRVFFTVFLADFFRFFPLRLSAGHRTFFDFLRFYRDLFGWSFYGRKDDSAAPVCAACSAPPPNLCRELLALFLWCVVHNLPAGVVRTSGVLKGRLGVLGECIGSGIELVGALAHSGARHCQSEPGITFLAEVSQVVRRAVRFVPILVVYYHITSRTADRTLGRSGRAALRLVRSIPLRPVANFVDRFPPESAALACGTIQSWLSSSSSWPASSEISLKRSWRFSFSSSSS